MGDIPQNLQKKPASPITDRMRALAEALARGRERPVAPSPRLVPTLAPLTVHDERERELASQMESFRASLERGRARPVSPQRFPHLEEVSDPPRKVRRKRVPPSRLELPVSAPLTVQREGGLSPIMRSLGASLERDRQQSAQEPALTFQLPQGSLVSEELPDWLRSRGPSAFETWHQRPWGRSVVRRRTKGPSADSVQGPSVRPTLKGNTIFYNGQRYIINPDALKSRKGPPGDARSKKEVKKPK